MMVLLMEVNSMKYLSFTREILYVRLESALAVGWQKIRVPHTGKESSATLAHSSPQESEKDNNDSINGSTQEKTMVSAIT